MSTLDVAVGDYLRLRRAMGFKLQRAEKLLGQFLAFLDEHDEPVITADLALTWAGLSEGASSRWVDQRLGTVRCFAAWWALHDSRTQVPPSGLTHCPPGRAVPYLYTPAQVTALMDAAARLPRPLRAATISTVIGLLAITGMRVGEVLALDRDDADIDDGLLVVRDAKFGKSRLVPLHPSAQAALRQYQARRDDLCPHPFSPALFITGQGTRLGYNSLWRTFHDLSARAALRARSSQCRPRIHDFRHSFAVTTFVEGYRDKKNIDALLPTLATYLGHADPKHTYWYYSDSRVIPIPAPLHA
ncbi:tyrosine-type recombinase/integrase [Lapillicoccus sp.]|uniref:tyrosine-type recombinase/integrase n=1 Tax=Lapillicoccus sp. TaxID=1909287 RepID=UPI0025E2C678|nr:tyrosine-type recombinase/integrase [Lapillicoccus sp.]